MFKILIPAVACLGLLTFAAKTQALADDARPEVQAAMGWHISLEGRAAKLAYGLANSDHLAIMVICSPGEAEALVYGNVRPGPTHTNDMSGMDETPISLKDPTLRRLADRGSITVHGVDGTYPISATPVERRAIGHFLEYCARKSA